MNVILTDKRTKTTKILQENLTEREAESICEAWGWNYCDENGVSYWMSLEDDVKELTKKVWAVAESHQLTALIEFNVEDFEAFCEPLRGCNDDEIVKAIEALTQIGLTL